MGTTLLNTSPTSERISTNPSISLSSFFVSLNKELLFTNLNNYPLNIFIHGLGAIGWSIAGLITKDKALMTNFGLQIPLFVIGYTYYLS